METLNNHRPQQISGGRVLNLVSIEPSGEGDAIKSLSEIKEQLLFGDELKSQDTLFIDGENSLNLLPRPDKFGNCILSLMNHLDTISPDTKFRLTIDQTERSEPAAD